LRYILSSIGLILPCFWLPRLEAGDLSSHIYNAWLAQLIANGKAPGLRIEPQWTNVLFDLGLSALWPLGPALAAKIAAAAAILIFVWGAFAFARAASAREPWFLLPVFSILSYGWVFQMGLFNFYVALGLCLWVIALAWRPSRLRIIGALLLMGLAYMAHALPVAWTLGVIGYRQIALRMLPRYRALLVVVFLAALLAAHWFIRARFVSAWSPQQIILISGTDQALAYGGKYQQVQLALFFTWLGLLVRAVRVRGWKRIAMSMPLHITLITAAAVAIIPGAILLPGYNHSLVFIAERMSLAIAVCICALLATARPQMFEMSVLTAAIVFFFGFLYTDARAVNAIEERLERAVAQAPAGARIVSTLSESEYRVDPLIHLIDRVCIARCFSYANYEPSTKAFRIRAEPGNPLVVASYGDSYALQTGRYEIRPGDLPLYGVFAAGDEFTVRPLALKESFQMARLLQK
jgi:hypothetical protein